MYFGIGPFGFGINFGNQQPQQQHFFPQPPQQQGQGFPQNQFNNQPPPNNPGFFGGLFDNFMNPFFQNNQNRNQQPQQEAARPSFFRKNNKDQGKKQSEPAHKTEVVNENSGYFWKVKGNEAFQKGRYDEAVELYSKAITLNNTESIYFSNRAQAYKKLGKIEEALKDAQEAIELDTTNARGHILAGQCLAQLGKREDSIRKLENAIVRLTKALTLSSGKRLEIEKEASRYIYLAKKVLFYIKFNEVRNARLQALKEYRDYLQKDEKLDNETKEKKMQEFVQASDEQIVFSIPQYLQCRITFDLMEDPVVTDSGQVYERFAIEEHIEKNGRTDPFTRQPLKGPLYPCITIKKAIQEFLDRNPWAYEYTEGQNFKDIQF